jgi:hypothetical protein
MRRLVIPLATIATVALAATPALAGFDPHFHVISKSRGAHEVPGGFAFHNVLVDPQNPVNKVGYQDGVCKPNDNGTAFCRNRFHFSGEIGGHGDIRASGVLSDSDQRTNVNGGSGAFDGAAGKVLQSVSRLNDHWGVWHFDLVR